MNRNVFTQPFTQNSTSTSSVSPSSRGSSPGPRRIFPSGVIGIIPLVITLFGAHPVAHAFGAKSGASQEVRFNSESDTPFAEGLRAGTQSADRISLAIAQKTINRAGCSVMHDYERAVTRILRTLQPPRGTDGVPQAEEQFVQGYFVGYSDQIRESLREQREICEILSYESGTVPGEIQGSYLCAAWQFSPSWVQADQFQIDHLYSGWTEGSVEVESECYFAVDRELSDCTESMPENLRDRLAFAACSTGSF